MGKTTSASALAVKLSKSGQRTLLITTDPASNLRDVFPEICFGPAGGINRINDTLDALEVSPEASLSQDPDLTNWKEFVSDMPGIDEAAALASLSEHAKNYDRIVVDTAPTGHTLRLLALPVALGGAIEKLSGVDVRLGGLWSKLTGSEDEAAKLRNRLTRWKGLMEELAAIFTDAKRSTFIVVAVPEYLR